MDRSPVMPKRHPVIRVLAVALLAFIALGLLPVFPRMLGFNFLPSNHWVSMSGLASLCVGLCVAAFMLWTLWRTRDRLESGFKKVLAFAGAPIFGFFLGKNAIAIALPMIMALIAGHQIELSFVVAHADRSGSKGCRSSVELQHLPVLFSAVCRVNNQFRHTLSPGMKVAVHGYGTELGVFADGIRRLD